ncbi:glycosyltransferase family 2 protein [Tabrizicola sp.]|uniref:glycosyltransferase family 2 protein n=1 Tax=Tabrizicola sp. TaxID=2005166 RepID=UPI0026383F1B|nr:glycosyltransferase family 2 protein [Tabrizicola sp.]MDM7932745.1 glycosyltransferase family 2 protein [Tabrizicola sp.]
MTIKPTTFQTDMTSGLGTGGEAPPGRIVIIIPTLNEARHIVSVIRAMEGGAGRLGAHIVVVDGGSTDGTVDIVQAEAERTPGLVLLHNPRRLQSAAINLAVDHYADRVDWIIRVDAHAGYPVDYCDALLAEAQRTGADSVVVRMHATGQGVLQRNIAAAQNSLFGNGGSAHRGKGEGRFVEHGHHALMRVAAFRAVGGYDEDFSHNEDAELDQRLVGAGFRIWLTAETRMDYYPRDTLRGLARQYYRFGAGRLATAWKHPGSLSKRHFILISLAPLALLAALAPTMPLLALPFAAWLLICLLAGLLTAVRGRKLAFAFCGLPAAVMQMAWSVGFWGQLLRLGLRGPGRKSEARQRPRAMTGE